uniref:Pectinesterase inhibitor domain-containing protein n=1 Tax=Kalanchoe fedtschenkoi TaxID=63787 RepID=A0A7N0U3I3_KALFE
MSFSYLFTILLISFVTAAFAASSEDPTFSVKISAQDVDKICSGVPDKNYCLGVLNSDPRAKTADFKGVAGILVQKAYFDASTNNNKLAWLVRGEKNEQLKRRYITLSNFHGVILGRLVDAKGNLNDANNIYLQTEAALAKIYSCEDLFLYPAPAEPTDLPKRIKELENVANMILAVVNLIPK